MATRNILMLALVAFLFLGTFGFSHIGMNTTSDGHMSDCPFTPGVAICDMSPLEMISASQNFLNALPVQKDIALMLALLLAAAFLSAALWRLLSPSLANVIRAYASPRTSAYIPPHSYLQEAFSSGILNPKIF